MSESRQKPAPAPAVYAVMAEFATPRELLRAANRIRAQGYRRIEAYTPFPIHGLDVALGHSGSLVPWIVLGGGLTGAAGGFLLQWWTSALDYPIKIAGKPYFSWPTFVPVTFELGILFSGFAAILGMLALNKLPQPYHPTFKHTRFKRVTDDAFFLAIEADDPQFHVDRAERDLAAAGGTHIEVLES